MKKRYVEFRVDDVESMLEARSVIEDCLMALYQKKTYGTTDPKIINEIAQREFLKESEEMRSNG